MKKWLLWILCGVLCTCVVSCRRSDEWKLKVASLTLEYGEDSYADVKLQDVLEYPSGSDEREVIIVLLSAQGEKIDEEQASAMTPLAVGSYTLEFYCGEETELLSLPVTIKDTVAPEFKDFTEKVSVDYGYDKVLTKLFSAEDLADVAIRIDGAVDTKKAGDYKVTVIAEDTSGNRTENECTITVKEKTAAGRSSSEKPEPRFPTALPTSVPFLRPFPSSPVRSMEYPPFHSSKSRAAALRPHICAPHDFQRIRGGTALIRAKACHPAQEHHLSSLIPPDVKVRTAPSRGGLI